MTAKFIARIESHRPTRTRLPTFRIPAIVLGLEARGSKHERQEYLAGCTDDIGIEDGDGA